MDSVEITERRLPANDGQQSGSIKRGRSFNDRRPRPKSLANRSNSKNVGIVIGDFTGMYKDELALKLGDRIEILTMDTQVSRNIGWWTGKDGQGKIGIFPSTCVKVVSLSSSCTVDEPAVQHEYPLELSFDDITLTEEVGMGGFGKVYRGKYREEEVAVKVARNTTFDTLKAIKEVLSEAEKFARLAHPNVCALVGVCLVKDVALVMEYARGGALSKVLHERKISLPVDVLLNWATQISEGMCYLHHDVDPPLLHRDLKSSNILLTNEVLPDNLQGNVIKITDFGLAKEIEHTTHMSGAGTFPWMAPEVIKAQSFSKKSDVWSFGVVTWELLTGEKPYAGLNMWAIIFGVGQGTLSLPIPEGCPVFLRELMNACWKRPHQNRPSFEDICKVLQCGSKSKSEFLSKGTEEINSMRSLWKEDIKKELNAFKKLETDLHNKEDAFHEKMQHECDAKAPVPTLEKVVGSKRREKGKKEERPPRVKPFSLKKLVRFFSKPESKREGAALPRKQMSEGMADYADQASTPTFVITNDPHRPQMLPYTVEETNGDSMPRPGLHYDSDITNTSCSDASGHSSTSHGPHRRATSFSGSSECCSPSTESAPSNRDSPYLINFNAAPSKGAATSSTTKKNLHPLAMQFDPLLNHLSPDSSPSHASIGYAAVRLHQTSPPARGFGSVPLAERHAPLNVPAVEWESPCIVRPRPRPRNNSLVEVTQFRTVDGPFNPPKSPTGSIRSLTTYPTYVDTSIPYQSDDGSSVNSLNLMDHTPPDVAEHSPAFGTAILTLSFDGGKMVPT